MVCSRLKNQGIIRNRYSFIMGLIKLHSYHNGISVPVPSCHTFSQASRPVGTYTVELGIIRSIFAEVTNDSVVRYTVIMLAAVRQFGITQIRCPRVFLSSA